MMYRNTLGVSLLGCVNRSAMLCSSWDTIWSALVLMMGAGVVLGAAVVVVVVTVWLDLDLDFLLRDLLDTRNRLKPGAAVVVVVVVVVVTARFFLPKILPEKCKETLFDSINSICKEKEASRTFLKIIEFTYWRHWRCGCWCLLRTRFRRRRRKSFPCWC